jgi:type VI secretion system secreted protein VgrG
MRDVPKPRTTGPQTAFVTGPENGPEIWTDKYGGIKLKFQWDRSPVRDHHSSCWVRVSYPWAGSSFGGINIPRVGQEVIVDFENGDPDRPIVVGRVYNGTNMPPWDLPANATQSGMLSRSMEGGSGNANAIRFEDKKGQEELWLQAERDMRTEVENDEQHTVGHDEQHAVGHDRAVSVKHDHATTTGNNQSVSVGGGYIMSVGDPLPEGAAAPAGVFQLNVKNDIVIQCGKASITMTKDGLIHLSGVQIVEEATGEYLMKGKQIDLNP